jgi:hypothetical protein
MTIAELIITLQTDWGTPRNATHRGAQTPFPLVCNLQPAPETPATTRDARLPPALAEFWSQIADARLFEDLQYGQWGLELFSPPQARVQTSTRRSTRPRDYVEGDLVIGRFIGDSDLLIARCADKASDFGNIIVGLPIDPRANWYHVANAFTEFLCRYLRAEGDKYWEIS